jgi:toxin ParE1/3/4
MTRCPTEYRLSPAAQGDLDTIWSYTAQTWSVAQAEAYLRGLAEVFAMLCAHPGIARERQDVTPPVRLHPYRAHLVIYRIAEDHVVILRVVHGRRKWALLLDG